MLALMLVTMGLRADITDALPGEWIMSDETPALMSPANAEKFTISRIVPGKTQWADGSFFLKWRASPRPDRGYYSLATRRVWITTYRTVDHEKERVEYQGTINENGEVTWEGAAKTTGRKKTTWSFVATRS